jgi:hypothetical protein
MAGRTYALRLDQMREAARLYADGWSHSQLAERFGVSRNAVQNALAYTGVKSRTHQAGRAAASNSGFLAWKAQQRRASAPLAQTIAHWGTQ